MILPCGAIELLDSACSGPTKLLRRHTVPFVAHFTGPARVPTFAAVGVVALRVDASTVAAYVFVFAAGRAVFNSTVPTGADAVAKITGAFVLIARARGVPGAW